MRRIYVTLVVVIIGAVMAAPSANARPLAPNAAATCYGVPGKVVKVSTGVRAGAVYVRCAGSWSAFQGILWFSDSATQRGKWSYGGTRTVVGKGNTTVAAWTRPYHGCGYWKQEWRMAGASRFSDVTWFCA